MEAGIDSELITRLQGGSLEALGQLYDRHRSLVFRTALAITGDADVAADLLQDVFLRLHRFISHVDVQRPLEPWLYRMTTNLAYTWVKRKQRWQRPLEDLADWLAGNRKNTTLQAVEKNDESNQLRQALLRLPLNQRVVVVLYYIDDQSVQEISDILDVPIGTIKSRLHYGRLALKQSLAKQSRILPELQYEFT